MNGFIALAPNVYRLAVPFPGCWTGVTLVTGTQNILVDSGSCAETVDKCIIPALKALGLTLESIAWLVFTHTHGDHVGGAARLLALHPHLQTAAFHTSVNRLYNPMAYSQAIRARFPEYSPPTPTLEGIQVDRLLQDGEKIGQLTLLFTPGHDSDSCCFWDERSHTLITGDSLQLNGTVSQGCALLMNVPEYESTLHRLMEMPIENIICGHPYLPLGAEAIGKKASLIFLQTCIACHSHDEGFVSGMLTAGIGDAPTIARALIAEVGGQEPAKLFLPLYTVSEYITKRRKNA